MAEVRVANLAQLENGVSSLGYFEVIVAFNLKLVTSERVSDSVENTLEISPSLPRRCLNVQGRFSLEYSGGTQLNRHPRTC